MKSSITLKELNALSFDAVQITDAKATTNGASQPQSTPESVRAFPVQPDRSDQSFREMLHERATAPYVSAIAYHRWGINE